VLKWTLSRNVSILGHLNYLVAQWVGTMPIIFRRLKTLSVLAFFFLIAGTPMFAYPVAVNIVVTFSEISGQPDPLALGVLHATAVITTTIESANATGTSATYPAMVNVTTNLGINFLNQTGTVTISTNGEIDAAFSGAGASFTATLETSGLSLTTPSIASFGGGTFSATTTPASTTNYTILGKTGTVGITGTINASGLVATPLSGFSVSARQNGPAPTAAQVSVGSNASGTPPPPALSYVATVSPAATWLTLTGATGTTPGTVTANFSTALSPGTYTTNVLVDTVGATDTNGQITIPISYTVSGPPPGVTSLSPNSATAGAAAFTLTVNGTNFVSGDTVKWAGTALTTTFVSATQLTAAVPATLVAAAGSASVTVVAPGNLVSNGSSFTINPAAPATHLSVTAPATAGSGVSFNATVTALDASNQPVPTFSGPVHFTSSDPSATLPADTTLNGTGTFSVTLATAGTQTITVTDPSAPSISGTSGNITVATISGSRFVPVSPCRLVDTRGAAGPLGGPFVPGNGSRDFPIASSSSCTIPNTAQAYSLNLTVVPKGTLGYVTLWPTGQAQPVVSTLNSIDGRVKANASIVPAGTGGAVSVFATDNTDVILDINGYFVPSSNSSAESFYTMAPCRLVDTRASGSSTVSTGALIGGTNRTLPLLSSSCGVPATAKAYSLNFTVIPSNGTLGYLTVYPTGVPQPLVSTLNALTGTIVANAAIVPAGTSGSIDVYATDTTDLIVDINGYFAAPGTGGLSFYPVTPCRVLDSRQPANTPPFTGTINVNVSASGCVSANTAQAYVFNATVVPPAPLGYLTLWPEGSAQPVVSTLNALDGAITSNMAIVPANANAISAFAENATYLLLDTAGYFAP
jgi:hypothetical protein